MGQSLLQQAFQFSSDNLCYSDITCGEPKVEKKRNTLWKHGKKEINCENMVKKKCVKGNGKKNKQ